MHRSLPTAWQPAAPPAHYAALAEEGVASRRASRIAGLRSINNEAKRALFERAISELDTPPVGGVRIVDLCCGRGGDVGKFVELSEAITEPLAYVGVDVSPEQVSRGRARHPGAPGIRWAVADCFSPEKAAKAVLEAAPDMAGGAHIVSCQFALHYACSASTRLHALLDAVDALCVDGGVFCLTTTDAGPLLEYALQEQSADAVCHVTLEEPVPEGPFGAAVHFRLDDRVNDREWLVHAPTLVSELQRRGFEKILWENLQDFSTNSGCSFRGVTSEDWGVSRLYAVGLFRKRLSSNR